MDSEKILLKECLLLGMGYDPLSTGCRLMLYYQMLVTNGRNVLSQISPWARNWRMEA